MPGPNAFERLHEAWIRGTEIKLSGDDVALLFELLEEQILDANVSFLQSGQHRPRYDSEPSASTTTSRTTS